MRGSIIRVNNVSYSDAVANYKQVDLSVVDGAATVINETTL